MKKIFHLSTFKKIKEKIQQNPKPFFILSFAILLWMLILFFGLRAHFDENCHYKQIRRIANEKFEMVDNLTTLPGYHITLGLISNIFLDISIKKVRFLSFLISLSSLFLFFLVAKKMGAKKPLEKTFQFAFLPISFIYFPIIYTDIFSATLILLSLFLIIQKKFFLAGLFSLFSIATRQNNIVWHIFLMFYSIWTIYQDKGLTLKELFLYFKKNAVFLGGIAYFIFFVWLNDGIAIGDKANHQFGFYMGNIYFFLALSAIIFLPILLFQFFKIKRNDLKRIFIGGLFGIIIITLFLNNVPPLHTYNFDSRFLRNNSLLFFYNNHLWFYSILIFFGTLTLSLIKLKKFFYLIYPFSILYLIPSWLIEQRYTIIPFILILLFREKKEDNKMETFLLVWFMILSLALSTMIIFSKKFF